jgi:hypothetical protein
VHETVEKVLALQPRGLRDQQLGCGFGRADGFGVGAQSGLRRAWVRFMRDLWWRL